MITWSQLCSVYRELMYFTEMRLRIVRRRMRTADCRQLQTCLSLSLSLSATATLACLAWGPPLSLRHYITVTLQDRLSHLPTLTYTLSIPPLAEPDLVFGFLFSPCLGPGSVGSEKSVQSVQCGSAGSSGLPHRGLTQDPAAQTNQAIASNCTQHSFLLSTSSH